MKNLVLLLSSSFFRVCGDDEIRFLLGLLSCFSAIDQLCIYNINVVSSLNFLSFYFFVRVSMREKTLLRALFGFCSFILFVFLASFT